MCHKFVKLVLIIHLFSLFQFHSHNDFSNIAAEVEIITKQEVIDLGEDLTADDWITWIDNTPKKDPNAQYLVSQWDPDWDPYQSKFHDDHSYANKDIGKKVHDLKDEIKIREDLFKAEKEKFLQEKKKLRLENLAMKRQLHKAQRDLKNLQDTSSTKGKAHMEQMVRTRLADHFSQATLDLILDKSRQYSKKWTNKDFCFAMLLKMVSPKALKLLRKSKVLPMPSNSTLKRKFSFMHVTPGKISNCQVYLVFSQFKQHSFLKIRICVF